MRSWREGWPPFLWLRLEVKENELPAVIRAMQQRLDREATKSQAETLWTATYLLMGLNYSNELIDRLLEGVQNMKESVTYQKILREGRAEGAKRILKRLGSKRLGKPEPRIEAEIDAIADLEKLEQLSDRVLEVTDWEELLAQL